MDKIINGTRIGMSLPMLTYLGKNAGVVRSDPDLACTKRSSTSNHLGAENKTKKGSSREHQVPPPASVALTRASDAQLALLHRQLSRVHHWVFRSATRIHSRISVRCLYRQLYRTKNGDALRKETRTRRNVITAHPYYNTVNRFFSFFLKRQTVRVEDAPTSL